MKFPLLLPLVLALAACSGNQAPADTAADATTPTATETAAVISEADSLGRYHWQLTGAVDAQDGRIDALFARDDQPVQLDFIDGRISVSNTCNRMNGSYNIADGQLQVGSMASTMMACIEPALAALDTAVGERLQGSTKLELVPDDNAPRLVLATATGDTLTFTGRPTAETRYGGEGKQVFMEVAAETAPCQHPLIPDKQCLQVRERTYDENGLVTGSGEWQPLYQDIEGYTHQPGVRNVLRLKQYTVANPPADGSSIAYVLDMVVESEQVAR